MPNEERARGLTVAPAELEVEQATAAPGERRNVDIPTESGLCEKPVVIVGIEHPCDREQKHKGACSYRGYA